MLSGAKSFWSSSNDSGEESSSSRRVSWWHFRKETKSVALKLILEQMAFARKFRQKKTKMSGFIQILQENTTTPFFAFFLFFEWEVNFQSHVLLSSKHPVSFEDVQGGENRTPFFSSESWQTNTLTSFNSMSLKSIWNQQGTSLKWFELYKSEDIQFEQGLSFLFSAKSNHRRCTIGANTLNWFCAVEQLNPDQVKTITSATPENLWNHFEDNWEGAFGKLSKLREITLTFFSSIQL